MKTRLLLFVLILGILSIQCDQNKVGPNEPDIVINLSEIEKSVVQSANTFGLTLFREMAADAPAENFFMSPFSVSTALSMAVNGAAGQTEQDMLATLGFGALSLVDLNQAYHRLVPTLTGIDPNVIVEIANGIWPAVGFDVIPDFLHVNQTYYDAEVQTLDFTSPTAPDIINDWISDKTHGKIEDMINELDPATMMVLANAIYFLGPWLTSFDPDLTVEAPFTLSSGNQVNCPMMTTEQELPYYETDGFQAVELPYGNGAFAMTILLPKTTSSVEDVVSHFTPNNWSNWRDALESTEVFVHMPRFEIEYDTQLNDVLTRMGMGIAFSPQADFTGINAAGGLYIDQVLHKAFVEVNEEGTEAAAATVIIFERTSIPSKPTIALNRPFIFIIREKSTDTLLFMGILENPISG